MAGFFVYSIDASAWDLISTTPTQEQVDDIVAIVEELKANGSFEVDEGSFLADADAVQSQLVKRDWYADFDSEQAAFWDDVIYGIREGQVGSVDVGFEADDFYLEYEMVANWRKDNVAVVKINTLGQRPFRYFGNPSYKVNYMSYHSIHDLDEIVQLKRELESILNSNQFESDEDTLSDLVAHLDDCLSRRRYLWVDLNC